MKLVKAAGAIVLGFYMCNAGVSASAVDMIQEEVQVAIEGRVIDRDAEVVKKATGKREGEWGELPAGRALKSPKSPKSCKSKASKTSKSSPTSIPLIDGWNAADEEVYEALVDATDVTDIDFNGPGASAIIDLEFTFNWFGTQFSNVCLSRFGRISIAESCGPGLGYINFVYSEDLDTSGGSIKYLQKSSPSSLKISFEDVKFDVGGGYVQAQVELFENGDILICYGLGDIPEERNFAAGVRDYTIQDDPFNEYDYTFVWPECKCWKFKMPETAPTR